MKVAGRSLLGRDAFLEKVVAAHCASSVNQLTGGRSPNVPRKACYMKNISNLWQRRSDAAIHQGRWVVGVGLVLALAANALDAAPANAVGTTSNTINVSAAPNAGSTQGTYTPKATATSGDTVVVTLDSASTGCSLSAGVVTFTGAGTCDVNFNDPGNSTYAAAAQVSQSIKVYAANTISTSAIPKAGSVGGRFAPGASATSGDKVVITTAKTSTGCYITGAWVVFTDAGTCKVNFNDPGNGPFAAASQVQKWVKVYAANTISVGTPPAAGAIHETYAPATSATSGDEVRIALNSGSTGCSLNDRKITFTANGVCVIDFNDPGNGAFAAAPEVRQTIVVGSGNPSPQAAIAITSTSTTFGHALTLTTVGGSGAGAVTYSVTSAGTAECSISGESLIAGHAGTCEIVATKASDGTYQAASTPPTTIDVTALTPVAQRLSAALWVGRTMTVRIYGAHFYGQPLVVSNAFGTSAVVTHDNGRVLTIRVNVRRASRPGMYRFTVVFSHGQRTSLRYRLR